MSDKPLKELDIGESPFPIEMDTTSVEMSVLNSGEMELAINLPNGETLYEYVRMPDGMHDQLFDKNIVVMEDSE